MKSALTALVLTACLALAGCFVSERPLFDGPGVAVFGRGLETVTTYENNADPDTGHLQWTSAGYIDPDDDEKSLITFHHMPGGGWFSPWYIGQAAAGGDKNDGYMYALYRKNGSRMNMYDVSCSDLSAEEAAAAHLVRSESGQECTAARAEDLAQAFRILAKRKPSKGYMTTRPAS